MVKPRSASCVNPPMAWQSRPDASESASSVSRLHTYAPMSHTAQKNVYSELTLTGLQGLPVPEDSMTGLYHVV